MSLSLKDKQALLEEQQTNNVSVKSMATEVRNPEKGTGKGVFIGYVAYKKGAGKINVQHVEPRASATGCYAQTATITLRDIVPTEKFQVVDSNMYNVFTKIRYPKGEEETVKEFIKEHKIAPFYDADTEDVIDSMYVPVSKNTSYDITLMTYKAPIYRRFVGEDSEFSAGKFVKMSGLVPQMQLSIYTVEKETKFKHDFGFLSDNISIIPSENDSEIKTLAKIYNGIYKKGDCPLPDIKDVLDGKAHMPTTLHYWFDANLTYMTEDSPLIRIIEPATDKEDFVRNLNTEDRPTKIQAKLYCKDIYSDRNKRFISQITAYEQECKSTGLDTEDFDIWSDIMIAHPLSAHVICAVNENGRYGTRQVASNLPGEVARRGPDTDSKTYHGTYISIAKQWVVDWEDTLEKRGIEIDKKTFLDTFKEANKNLKNKKDRKFTIPTVDGEEELRFVSVLPYENPIAKDGLKSKVIPFGSGTRPTFSCDDATPIIEGKNVKFYALTGVYDKEWVTMKQGCATFKKQLKEGVSYQLFVVQNCGEGKKKGKK